MRKTNTGKKVKVLDGHNRYTRTVWLINGVEVVEFCGLLQGFEMIKTKRGKDVAIVLVNYSEIPMFLRRNLK